MTMSAVDKWLARLRVAQSEDAVIHIVREYLATWTPSDIGDVPATSWPGEATTKTEILNSAVQVKVDELRAVDGPARVSMQELAEVLAAASARFGQLNSPFRAPTY